MDSSEEDIPPQPNQRTNGKDKHAESTIYHTEDLSPDSDELSPDSEEEEKKRLQEEEKKKKERKEKKSKLLNKYIHPQFLITYSVHSKTLFYSKFSDFPFFWLSHNIFEL